METVCTDVVTAPPRGWETVIEATKETLLEIETTLQHEVRLYSPLTPRCEHVFLPFYLCPLEHVRVVWVTASPLHGVSFRNVGNPLSQGLGPGTERCDPPSLPLRSIMSDEGRRAPHGDLRTWAYQGVLFVALSLTAPRHSKIRLAHHTKAWTPFTHRLLAYIADARPDTVFVFFGDAVPAADVLPPSARVLRVHDPVDWAYPGTNLFTKINDARPPDAPRVLFEI